MEQHERYRVRVVILDLDEMDRISVAAVLDFRREVRISVDAFLRGSPLRMRP